jgi:hypothetical protein
MTMYLRIPIEHNAFRKLERPELDDCYVCLSPICNDSTNSAVFQFKCIHPVCVNCILKPNTEIICFSKLINCGICRAKPNKYITECATMCKVPYSEKQSIYVPAVMVTSDTFYRDHLQHIIANSF